MELKPQPGPQTDFLASSASIVIYGGAAGGGKTYSLLLEPMRHFKMPGFTAVIFRKTLADVKKAGSLWDTSFNTYAGFATPKIGSLTWEFESGAKVIFGYLERMADCLNWQGSQIPLLCFDELTHFDKETFFYMLSRNRSVTGIKPYVRATTNPDADSWVAEFLSWWIDQETGFAIPERAGQWRWFVRINDEIQWGETERELKKKFGSNCRPKSVTFIPAKLSDNKILMQTDPGYEANLQALTWVQRQRLLGGNWKIKPSSGLYFRRAWVKVVDQIPAYTQFVRGWDLAATEKTAINDPDFTCSTKIGRMMDGRFIVTHHSRMQESPQKVESAIRRMAEADGKDCRIHLPQDPGSAGKMQVSHLGRILEGFEARFAPANGDKITRFSPFSAQAEAGNITVLRGAWNEVWFSQLENFPEGRHDDDADSTAEAFNGLANPDNKAGQAIWELERRRALERQMAEEEEAFEAAEVLYEHT